VALVAALEAAIERAGGEVRSQTHVTGVTISEDRVTGVALTDGETVSAGHVVAAAGWSGGELDGLDPRARVPLRPVKGQLLHLRDSAGPGLLTRVLRSEDAYLVPRGDGRYVLGATMEERGADTTVTAGAAFELLRAGVELVPGVMELEMVGMRAGLRPATPDNSPAIGPAVLDGLSWASGHYRHGVLLAPITAEAVVAGITGAEAPPTAAPFAPQRFAPTGDRVLEPGVPA
jgi:glycine oxidase